MNRQPKHVLYASLYWDERLMMAVSRYAKRNQWVLNMATALDGRIPTHWKGDGIIALAGPTTAAMDRLRKRVKCPTVMIGLSEPSIKVPRVSDDYEAIGRLAAQYYLERNFRSFALYTRRWPLVSPIIWNSFSRELDPAKHIFKHIQYAKDLENEKPLVL